MKAVLEERGFNVVTVLNPNWDRLYKAFEDFINEHEQGAENRILIYFAGHGHTEKLSWGGDMGYIVPIDAPNPSRDQPGFLKKAMDMQQIEVYAKRIQSKHVLFLFDACFSGSIFDLSRAAPQHITSKTAQPVRQFITSGSAEEEVPDRSVFRSQFVEALKGEGDVDRDGYVTGAELGEFLQNTVINYSKGCQHPQYGKIRDAQLDKGDFVFELAAAAPPPPKVIPGPNAADFSLDDLNKAAAQESQAKAQWADYQKKMSDAYAAAEAYAKQDAQASLKVTAWERFQKGFAQDNSYSSDDETLRARASDQIKIWKAKSAEPKPSPPVAVDQPQRIKGPLTGMEFVLIPGGSFLMGSPDNEEDRDSDEGPQHRVTLKPFFMMTTEVTQKMWVEVMGSNPSDYKGDNLPVETVSWNNCQEFIKKLNQRYPGKGYRLPSEAEWEYACRAGTTARFYSGNSEQDLARVGWYLGNSDSKTHPVSQKTPNAWGLYDMHGNVWEWCADGWHDNYNGAPTDGSAWTSGGDQARRVLRGGSWNLSGRLCRASLRNWNVLDNRLFNDGFRLVVSSSP